MPRRSKQERPPAQTSLRLGLAGERLVALRRERDRLVRQIGTKQTQVEKAVESAQDAASALFEKLPALVARRRATIAEIRAIFAELLTHGRLARKAQRAVLDVLGSLRASGLLEDDNLPFGEREGEGPRSHVGFEPPFEDEDTPFGGARGRRPPGSGVDGERDGSSAAHVGGQADKAAVREVFRRLAVALHPDRTQLEPERQRRTEIMKEVTRAYEEGDLARLLRIEATWLAGVAAPAEGADAERELASLERVVGDLKRQLKELTKELRELKRSSPLGGLSGFARRDPEKSPIDVLLQEAEQELETLSSIREYVRKYRDREISLAEFLRGPDVLREVAYGDGDLPTDLEILQRILAEELDSAAAPQKKRARKRR